MKLIKNNIFAAMLLVTGAGLLAGCQEKESQVAKAVLASVSGLSFEAEGSTAQIITVYSDAPWTADVPEWVTIDPVTGSGTVDVTVSVSDNVREGAPDNPRKADLVFHGNTIASRAVVSVSQSGDKYRDVPNSSVSDVVGSPDGTVVIVSDAQVVALTSKGAVVSDGKANLFVPASTESFALGDKVSFKGDKGTESSLPALTACDEFRKISGGQVAVSEPKDITKSFDTYSSSVREYVAFKGVLSGSQVEVNGAAVRSANIIDPHSSTETDLKNCNGHFVTVKGYFAGATESFVSIMVSEIQDDGLAEKIYWVDDFEWVKPYADDYKAKAPGSDAVTKKTVSDCVAEKTSSDAGTPNIYTDCVKLDVLALDDLRNRGYTDLNPSMKTIYMQLGYFKYGATDKQSGLQFSPFADDEGEIEDEISVSFDWCPHISGDPVKLDAAKMVVRIEGNGYVVTSSGSTSAKVSDAFAPAQTAGDWKWETVVVKLRGVDKDTKVTICPEFTGGKEDPSKKTYMRYYMDNIKIWSDLRQE